MLIKLNQEILPDKVVLPSEIFNAIEEDALWEPWMDNVSFHLLQDMREVTDYFESALASSEYIAIDLETTGLNVRKAEIVGMSFSYRDNECAYIPLRHSVDLNVPYDAFITYFKSIISRTKWVFYNAKYDAEVLLFNGVQMESEKDFEDAMLCVCLHDSNLAQNNAGLKMTSKNHLGKTMIEFSSVTKADDEDPKGETFKSAPTDRATIYAGSDALITRELYEKFKYVKVEQKIIYELETKLIDVVRNMERVGVRIDVEYFNTLNARLSAKLIRLKKGIFEKCGVPYDSFNLDSGPQVGKVFFEDLGIENPYRTATGKYKVDKQTMIDVAELTGNEVLLAYKDYKSVQKLLSNYIAPYISNPDLTLGYLAFKQFQISTGRFGGGGGKKASHYLSGVNPQNIPSLKPKKGQKVRKILNPTMTEAHYRYEYIFDGEDANYCLNLKCVDCPFIDQCENVYLEDMEIDTSQNIRRGFITRSPKNKLFTVDFSGVELRMATNLSGEPKWIDSFLNGDGDLHTLSAMDIYKKGKDDISKSERDLGKTVNFLALYGGGSYGLSQQANIPTDEAGVVLKNFWDGVPAIDKLRHQVWHDTEVALNAYTHMGRKRPMQAFVRKLDEASDYEEKKEIRKLHSKAQREAFSHKIQGSSADLLKLAMLACSNAIKERGWEDKLMILITVHDELVFECSEDIIQEAMKLMSKCMQVNLPGFKVPFITDIEFSDKERSNWGMTEEYRVHTDGCIYPTKLLKKAYSAKMGIREYLVSIGKNPPEIVKAIPKVDLLDKGPITSKSSKEEIESFVVKNSIAIDILEDEGKEIFQTAKNVSQDRVAKGILQPDPIGALKSTISALLGERALEKLLSTSYGSSKVSLSSGQAVTTLRSLKLDIIARSVILGSYPKLPDIIEKPELLIFHKGASKVYVLGLVSIEDLKRSKVDGLGFVLNDAKLFKDITELVFLVGSEFQLEVNEVETLEEEVEGFLKIKKPFDNTSTRIEISNLDTKVDSTFNFKNVPLTFKLARQLDALFSDSPGQSDIYLDFSLDDRKIFFKRRYVSLEKFRKSYVTFFGE